MRQIEFFLNNNLTNLHMPAIRPTDLVQILIISFLMYHLLIWMRKTRIWSLFKGLVVILVFILLAYVLDMTTIIWIVKNVLSIAVIAIVVILQPELRKALEQLGRKNYLSGLFSFDNREDGRFSDRTINEIARACYEMAKVRTGALIVIRQNNSLADYELTGIAIDGIVSSQLLINIFEHNTPLHDGAVIISGDRITSATCYLPLSDNLDIDKDLGTRHRAGLGVSEVTDALILIVSEETEKISVAYDGQLERGVDSDRLKERMKEIQNKPQENPHKPQKGRGKAK